MRESANEICCEPNGKPYIPKGPHFSVSHGGAYAAFAVDDGPVGIDVEPMAESNFFVAPIVFLPDELVRMSERTLIRFHVPRTLKESVMKATGLGFSMPPQNF